MTFSTRLFRHPGKGGWTFAPVPAGAAPPVTHGWGRTPVVATVDGQSYETSVWREKSGRSLFWPDVASGDAVYIHRLAVRRSVARGLVAPALITWAADRGRQLGRAWLRLDCEAARTRLCDMYEGAGFMRHSERHVGPYLVARYQMPLRRTVS